MGRDLRAALLPPEPPSADPSWRLARRACHPARPRIDVGMGVRIHHGNDEECRVVGVDRPHAPALDLSHASGDDRHSRPQGRRRSQPGLSGRADIASPVAAAVAGPAGHFQSRDTDEELLRLPDERATMRARSDGTGTHRRFTGCRPAEADGDDARPLARPAAYEAVPHRPEVVQVVGVDPLNPPSRATKRQLVGRGTPPSHGAIQVPQRAVPLRREKPIRTVGGEPNRGRRGPRKR